MDLAPAVPDGGAALDDGHDLLGEAGRELRAPGPRRPLAPHRVQDPHDGHAAARARGHRLGQLERLAAARGTLERAHADQRRHRVDRESEVEERVQRELGGWRGAREQGPQRGDFGGGGSAEVVEDQTHVLRSGWLACCRFLLST